MSHQEHLSEGDAQAHADARELHLGRQIEFYRALVDTWINTRMERDKQILSLSSLALGGLVAFQETGLSTSTEFWLWLIAGLLFIFAIGLALIILSVNAHYIEGLIKDQSSKTYESCLKSMDNFLMMLFVLGILAAFGLAVEKTGFEIVKVKEGVSHEQKQ